MFTTELYALLSEVLVGSATVATIALIIWSIRCERDEWFVEYLRRKIDEFLGRDDASTTSNDKPGGAPPHRENLLYALVGAVVLGLGLALESAVDDLIDPHPVAIQGLAWLVQLPFPSKTAFRFSAFYQPSKTRGSWAWYYPRACSRNAAFAYELTPLGHEVFERAQELLTPHLPINVREGTTEFALWHALLTHPDQFLNTASDRNAACELVEPLAQGIYYDGNNWAHRNEPGVNALRRWQTQIDTLGAVSILSFVITETTGVYFFWARLTKRKDRDKNIASCRFWLVGSLIVAGFCLYGYITALKGYTGRAIGMYSSAHHNEDVKLSPVGCHSLARLVGDLSTSPWCYKALKIDAKELGGDASLHRELTWFRNAAERQVAYDELYQLAWQRLQDYAGKPKGSWAVVIDADETILDNSEYQALMDDTNSGNFDGAQWIEWAKQHRAPAFASARDFATHVRLSGGLILIVTNRAKDLCAVTAQNLENQQVKYDILSCYDGSVSGGEKETRFADIASHADKSAVAPTRKTDFSDLGQFKVALYIGDNILDCPHQTQQRYDAAGCVILPNPMYGSWWNPAPSKVADKGSNDLN